MMGSPAHRRDRVRATHYGTLVLVAILDTTLRRAVCEKLAAHGYRAVIADAGLLELVHQLEPRAVIVDRDDAARAVERTGTPTVTVVPDVYPDELIAKLRIALRRA